MIIRAIRGDLQRVWNVIDVMKICRDRLKRHLILVYSMYLLFVFVLKQLSR
jgi:hypothetical protein